MAEQVFLAVDLGAESGRVIAGCFDGSRMQLNDVHRFPNGGVSIGGRLRWDVVSLWKQIEIGLGKAAEQYGDAVVSVGVDTWGVDFVLLSENDELLGLPYHYRDPRTNDLVALASTIVPRAEIFANTGLQFIQINSLYQMIAMQRENASLLEQADCFLMMADFFHWCLCGSRVVEFTNATTSQMLDPMKRDWAVDMLRKFQIPVSMLPEVVDPGTELGTLRNDVAERTGLGKIKVVAPATHDTGAAIAAIPTENTGQPNWAYISSGTWSLMGVEVADAILSERALELNVTNEGGIDGTFRLLKNIMGLWLVQQSRHAFQKQGQNYEYADLADLATQADPFTALVDPDHHDFMNPADMVEALQTRCEQTGEPVVEGAGPVMRCILESLALKYRMVLQGMEELTGVKVEVIHIVGGGTKNRILNQFTANACQVPVITGPVEATALGNVLVQARTSGAFSTLDELRTVSRASSEIERFEPTDSDAWNAAFERFTAICNS